MRSEPPEYDAGIIERFAANLYGKAQAVMLGSVVIGAVFGLAVGAVPLTSLGAAWPIPQMFGFATLLVGGIVGGVIGYVIGDARAFGYKLEAQVALAQLRMEATSMETARIIRALATAAATRRPAAPAARVPAPAPAPAPASAPAPAPAPASAPAQAPPPQLRPTPAAAPAPAPQPRVTPPVAPPPVAPRAEPPLMPPVSSVG